MIKNKNETDASNVKGYSSLSGALEDAFQVWRNCGINLDLSKVQKLKVEPDVPTAPAKVTKFKI